MYLNQAEISLVRAGISSLDPGPTDVIMVLMGEKNAPDLFSWSEELSREGVDFFGGVFPVLIYGDQKYEEGLILKKLPVCAKPVVVRGLDNKNFSLQGLPPIAKEAEAISAIVLLDGMADNISLFFNKLYNHYGDIANYLGGGAGSISLVQKPCLFSNEGVFENAAIICFTTFKSKLGVKHGWQSIAGPFLATDTQSNVIKELNWQNAFEVYKETIEKHSNRRIEMDNFFEVAKGFPFGITKMGSEYIVRDPISVKDNGELVCVGEIPENAALMILEGHPEYLIEAASEACKIAVGGIRAAHREVIIFDCISRVLFLEDHFEEELKAVRQEMDTHIIPFGALTLGEISSLGTSHIEFFNKTVVVGMLYKDDNPTKEIRLFDSLDLK